ncbi:glycosyltransferase [Spirosoma migulaei]
MKIAILTLGTRGDVQPYAVLGQALQERGHQVTLSAPKNFESLVKSYKLDFAPVEADFQALLDSEEGKKLMKNPLLAQRNVAPVIHSMIRDALTTFYQVSKANDKVLFHGKTLAGYFADQFPKKMIQANVVPAFEATGSFVNPVFSGLHLPKMLNRLSYKLTEWSYKMMDKPIREFRQANGLSSDAKNYPGLPSIYGISRHLLAQPVDYPQKSQFTGFWYGNSPGDLSVEVKEFIRKGKPPLLLTFGSMPIKTALNVQQAVLAATQQLGIRFLIVKGWGFENTADLKGQGAIKVIESAPYEKLMPLVKAVIHHGGIGTSAECLRAGKPFWACPVLYPLGDQHFWAQAAYQKGCALKPLPLKNLTEVEFLYQTEALLTTQKLYTNCQDMASLLQSENGLLNAVQVIESNTQL